MRTSSLAARRAMLETAAWKSSGARLFQPFFLTIQAEAELEAL